MIWCESPVGLLSVHYFVLQSLITVGFWIHICLLRSQHCSLFHCSWHCWVKKVWYETWLLPLENGQYIWRDRLSSKGKHPSEAKVGAWSTWNYAIWLIRHKVQSGKASRRRWFWGWWWNWNKGTFLVGTVAEMGQSLNVNLELPQGNEC